MALALAAGWFAAGVPQLPAGINPAANANPLHGAKLFADPESKAAAQAEAWRQSRPEQAGQMDKLAAQPTAKWLTSADSLAELPAYMKRAKDAGAVPVLVAYNIPLRDCGNYSAGGSTDAATYEAFIAKLKQELGRDKAIVILEPDALSNLYSNSTAGKPCLSDGQRDLYYQLLGGAVKELKKNSNTRVYIDAGHSAWIEAGEMVQRLRQAGVKQADGFSLNVSNFQTTEASTAYGETLSAQLEEAHFVIDTSRNGRGPYTNPTFPEYNWCNPPERALGHYPTTDTGHERVDAYLYIKVPGESDGQDDNPRKCFGGPEAGTWWPEYALGLVERWPASLQAK